MTSLIGCFYVGMSQTGDDSIFACRGYTYARNVEMEAGWIAWGAGLLIHRPYQLFDSGVVGAEYFVHVVDTGNLLVCISSLLFIPFILQ